MSSSQETHTVSSEARLLPRQSSCSVATTRPHRSARLRPTVPAQERTCQGSDPQSCCGLGGHQGVPVWGGPVRDRQLGFGGAGAAPRRRAVAQGRLQRPVGQVREDISMRQGRGGDRGWGLQVQSAPWFYRPKFKSQPPSWTGSPRQQPVSSPGPGPSSPLPPNGGSSVNGLSGRTVVQRAQPPPPISLLLKAGSASRRQQCLGLFFF